jgi:hypothetical protein
MLAVSGRCVSLGSLPRANAWLAFRHASSSSGAPPTNNNKNETVAVSSSSGSADESPMSQRPLPADDGKVRK